MNGQEQRVHYEVLRMVDKDVVMTDPVAPVHTEGERTMESIPLGPGNQNSSLGGDIERPPDFGVPSVSTSEETREPNVIKTIRKIEYEALCPQHNPVCLRALLSIRLICIHNSFAGRRCCETRI